MKAFTKFIGCLALVVTVAATGAFLSSAAEPTLGALVKSGPLDRNDPDRGSYELYEYGTLSNGDTAYKLCITGSGEMPDWGYSTPTSRPPWLEDLSYSRGITTLELDDGLTSIGACAFHECKNLALTSLPEGLTSIGEDAFYNCSNLALTSLPEGLTSIGEDAFYNCSKLALTSLPDGLTSVGAYAFYKCSNLALTSLPDGLTSIGNGAFMNCKNLALTSLPEGITSIGTSAFSGCKGMELTTLPNATVSVGSTAFYGVSWRVPENHYLQNTDGSYPAAPSEVTTQLVSAGTGSSAKLTTFKTFTGFTLDETALPASVKVPSTGVPYGDTTIKVDYYYTRNAYGVVWKNTDGRVLHTDENVFYGAQLTPPELTAPAGYTFTGWSPTVPDTMPDKALEFTAVFIPNKDTPYTIGHYQENITGDGYTLADTENGTGTTDTTATATAKSYTGFTENKTHTDRITSGNIHGDGSLTLKLYYDRNRHNITWRNEDGSVYHISEDVAYGMLIDPPDDPAKRGYTFTGWSPTVPDTMPDKALEFTAGFTPNYYSVTVTAADGGTASADCGNEAATDSTVSIHAAADNVHAFIGWTVLSGDVTLADPTAPSTTFVMPPEEVSIRAEFKGQIGVDTDGDGIPDTKIDANDKGEGKDAAAGDGIYTDDNGKKYEEQPKGSGTFIEVTGDYIQVDTNKDGIPDIEVKANDRGEGKDLASGDGIYTDESGRKFIEAASGSGVFVEVTGDYIQVDTNKDEIPDIEVKANDKGEGADKKAGDGKYTADDKTEYVEKPAGSGVYEKKKDDPALNYTPEPTVEYVYIQVDTNLDGVADISVMVNDAGLDNDVVKGDGVYTSPSGVEYVAHPTVAGLYIVKDSFVVDPNEGKIGVDTDGDGKPDTWVDAKDDGIAPDLVSNDKLFTDEDGKLYIEVADKLYKEVTSDYIKVDTDGDGKADIMVKANDNGIDGDITINDGIYTASDGVIYHDPDGDGVFTQASQSDFDAAQKYPADITSDEWYSEAVVEVVEKGIIETYEDRTFKANYELTRCAAVYAFAVLNNAELSSRNEILRVYNDVDATTQYATAIEWAAEMNLVLGYGDGSFGPEDPITREQLIAILHRQYSNVINEPSADIDAFNDADEVSEWALEYMRWAVGNGIVHGDGLGNLNPLQNVTRAEAATIITRVTARDGIGN